MVYRQLKTGNKYRRNKPGGKLFYAVFFVIFLLFFILLNAPLSALNYFLSGQGVKLLNAGGNLHSGQWHSLQIDKRAYLLSCHYQRLSGLTYRLNCQAPLVIEGKITFSASGRVTLREGLLSGDLSSLADWFALLHIPGELGGKIGLRVDKAVLKSRQLHELSLSGGAQGITLFGQPLLDEVGIKTLNDKWSPDQPIRIESRSPASQNQTAVYLFLDTRIDGNRYSTQGEIKGKGLGNYAAVLQFFGRQTAYDTFTVSMQGQLF